MEFNEKLQELRKQKGLTQEELSEILFVSRTAVSKWESGRGYPNIDSLKAISKYFSITIDELLSGEELLDIAEKDSEHKECRLRSLVYGLMDVSSAVFFFLPFFADRTGDLIREASLISLTGVSSYLKAAFFIIVIAAVCFGLAMLALQNCSRVLWTESRFKISLALNAAGILLFIISLQPYAAALMFVFMVIKLFLLLKKQ